MNFDIVKDIEVIKTDTFGTKQLKKEKEAIKKDAQAKASVWHATSELWDDGVIDPRNTREHLTMALATIYQNPIEGTDSFGVFRM